MRNLERIAEVPDSITRQDEFLLKEYESATELTNHIDELRNKLTGFYLTFAGVAVAGVAILIKDEARSKVFDRVDGLIAILLLVVALTGWIVVLGLARLRQVQIEYFGIINSIRQYFLGENYDLWNVVKVSKQTLPVPNRYSGSYMWLLLVILSSSSLFMFSVYLVFVKVFSFLRPLYGGLAAVGGFVLFSLLQDLSYFRWSKSKSRPGYSAENSPL